MKIYIAGKITGDPYYKAKFARAAADIADAGHTPINPAMQPEGMSNADYMRISFAQLDSADAVAFLPDWEDSKGARIEHLLVEYTGKRYCYADDHTHNAFDITCNGTIIGEFVCDSIDTYDDDTIFSFRHEDYARWNDFDLDRACIHPEDLQDYSGGKWLYGWHISGLKIYDEPRALSTLCRPYECGDCDAKWATDCNACHDKGKIKRPPQSWCYVEEAFYVRGGNYCPNCGARMDGDGDA